MSFPVINGAEINGEEGPGGLGPASWYSIVRTSPAVLRITALADGASPLNIGTHKAQLGTDNEIRPPGLNLVRGGWHSAELGMPAPNQAVTAMGSVVMNIGGGSVVPGAMFGDAAGSSPLVIGQSGVGRYAIAVNSKPLHIGAHGVGVSAFAEPSTPLHIGGASICVSVSPPGLRLGKAGVPSIFSAGSEAFADGSFALMFGPTLQPKLSVYARPSRPLHIGVPAIDRGTSC